MNWHSAKFVLSVIAIVLAVIDLIRGGNPLTDAAIILLGVALNVP